MKRITMALVCLVVTVADGSPKRERKTRDESGTNNGGGQWYQVVIQKPEGGENFGHIIQVEEPSGHDTRELSGNNNHGTIDSTGNSDMEEHGGREVQKFFGETSSRDYNPERTSYHSHETDDSPQDASKGGQDGRIKEFFTVPVLNVPISIPLKVRDPIPFRIPVPVQVEKTVQIPVEKIVPHPVLMPVPFQVVNRVYVPVPKPYPVPVPVYHLKVILHSPGEEELVSESDHQH